MPDIIIISYQLSTKVFISLTLDGWIDVKAVIRIVQKYILFSDIIGPTRPWQPVRHNLSASFSTQFNLVNLPISNFWPKMDPRGVSWSRIGSLSRGVPRRWLTRTTPRLLGKPSLLDRIWSCDFCYLEFSDIHRLLSRYTQLGGLVPVS